MTTKEIYDKDAGWVNTTVFEPHEVKALQIAGLKDDDISSLFPKSCNQEELDSRFGKFTYDTFCERKRFAKEILAKFWRRNTEDSLINLIRTNKALYWVETSATMTKVFKKCGAVPVHVTMMKYLLREDVTPSQDGYRYMHQEQETACHSAWKTLYLLPSLDMYDEAYHSVFGKDSYEITNAWEADSVVTSIYENIFEDQIYDIFPKWRKAMSKAKWFLKDARDTSVDLGRKAQLLNEINYYLHSDYRTLEIHAIPKVYLNTVADEYGVIFDESRKRIVGLNKDEFMKHKSYCVPETVEYIDDDVFYYNEVLKHIDLGNVRMIGYNQFIHTGLEELVIPSTVEYLGGCVCEGCTFLKRVEFKGELSHLDIACFNGCSALKEIKLPKNLIGISDNVFSGTDSLESLTLEDGLRYIGGECFMGSGLDSLTIPQTVMEVAEDAFWRHEDIELKLMCGPDYRNLPISMLATRPMPAWFYIERFQETWLTQLLRCFAYVVEVKSTNNRLHLLDSYMEELKSVLKWLNAIKILAEFPFYNLTTAKTTERTACYNIVFLYLTVCHVMDLEDWTINDKDKLAIAIMFRSQLSELYQLIEQREPADIDKYVDNLGEYAEPNCEDLQSFIDKCYEHLAFNPINPELLMEQEEPAAETWRLMQLRVSPVRIPQTSAWGDGPSLTTTTGEVKTLISHFKDILNKTDKHSLVALELQQTMTAKRLHDKVMEDWSMYYDAASDQWCPRVKPTKEQAEDYIRCVNRLKTYYENNLSDEDYEDMQRIIKEYESLNLDMRDVVFEDGYKVGVKNLLGKAIVPAEFDEIPETYSCIDTRWGMKSFCIPVVKDGKYGLFRISTEKHEGKMLTKKWYDGIFRYFSLQIPYFICSDEEGKLNIIDTLMGRELLKKPVSQIYEAKDSDGCILLEDDGKYGLVFGNVATEVKYDDVEICSEDYCRVRICNKWYWIDEDGRETDDKNKAFFGSFYDSTK